ncbi:hypothetical protein OIY81_1424 [Cryptosporidium canis]|uniref:Inner centromere protein ARK-binding domain-containing protein n=1 Tax=Cryptosporidium canis TaxID=195482 RepID=A0ABQ8P4Y0_9CRYT|nr:hypothetical protein OJ252_2916 [Cryptosporidium canis]KAJ1612081.1 hypothetical protein OIY81_1424 [Cryptosporidium canis]
MASLERIECGAGSVGMDGVETDGQRVSLEDFREVVGLLERAGESSLRRLDRTLELIEENFEGLRERLRERDMSSLGYHMCDIELPPMEVRPTEEEVEDTVNGFLRRIVEAGKIQLKQLSRELREVREVVMESIVAETVCEEEQIIESPKPKKMRDESGFVASMKRLWENKTPKLASIWRRNEESRRMARAQLGVARLEALDILGGNLDGEDAEETPQAEAVTSVIAESEGDMGMEEEEEEAVVETTSARKKEESYKSVSNEDLVSPGPPNAMSMGLTPLQSPPLLALTPSTPIPIGPGATAHQGQRDVSSSKTKSGTSGGGGILRTSVVIQPGEMESQLREGKERVSKSAASANEDSPLPPRPIRRQTSERTQETVRSGDGLERIEEDGERTPVLKGGLEGGTPLDKDRLDMGENGFVRPERISHVKKSGLRSILHHSANRIPPPDQTGGESCGGSAGGSGNCGRQSRGSIAMSHLVRTPTNKGFCKMETEGRDRLRMGESPCRRYHKRLKLLPPVNPEESYVLTDSEDEQGGGAGTELKIAKTQKKIPLWARSMNWIPKMKEQRHVDPFSIFGDSCMFMDLEDVFQRPWYISTVARDNRIKSWQNDRLTSLNWSEDSLTSDELRQYKMRMNLYIDKSNEVYVTEPCFTPSPNPLANGAWNHINKQRINSGGTTVIRKALNLSIHRLNNNIPSKTTSSKPSQAAPLSQLHSSETTTTSNIENNNLQNILSKPKIASKEDDPDLPHRPHIIDNNSSFLL